MSKIQELRQSLNREKTARQQAEALLERKTRELANLQSNSDELLKSDVRHSQYLNTLNKFAVEISSANTKEELAWYVVKEVVGKQGFEDCVVYLLNQAKDTLVQTAAFGIKNPEEDILLNPLRIPVGKGITGSVALTGEPEIIADVSNEERFIEDLNSSGSELCIPLIFDNETFGVIDTESTTVGFFDWEHYKILSTVASMTSARISQINQKNKLLAAREEADKANKAKSRFLSTMSHEIRSPVNGVLGSLNLLNCNELSEENRRLIEVARSSGELLKLLLDDLLDLGKLEAGKVTLYPQAFEIRKLVNQVSELYQPFAKAKNITLVSHVQAGIPDMTVGATARIRQVMINYLSNAIKFTEEGSITIGVRPSQTHKEHLCFYIKDTGVGIKEDNLVKLFDDFTQIGMGKRASFGGAGIGLAISKRLASLMQGRVGCKSSYGEGSEFWLELPFEKVTKKDRVVMKSRQNKQYNFKNKNGKYPRFLVAEDVPTNQFIMGELLKKTGATVDLVGTGVEVMHAISQRPYDVILMDMSMPEMDGPTATQKIRAAGHDMAKLPIVAVTAYNLKDQVAELNKLGFNSLIMKPIDEHELLSALAKELGIKALTRRQINKLPLDTASHETHETKIKASLSGIRKESYSKVLDQIKVDLQQDLNQINKTYKSGDLHNLESSTHRLKSTLGACGALELMKLAEIANREIKLKNKAPQTTDIEMLLAGGYDVISAVENLVQKTKTSGGLVHE